MDVLIANKKNLDLKIKQFLQDGISALHIISDFDRTLTKAFHDGIKTSNSIAQLRQGGYLGQAYVDAAYKEYEHYHPIEIDTKMSEEMKKPLMKEWWVKHLQLMINHGMSKSIIQDIITTKETTFREGFSELVHFTKDNSIPFLILSAGLGDIIIGFLKKYKYYTQNIHVFANFFTFKPNGLISGFNSDIVHVLNKDEQDVTDKSYLQQISGKSNILLLGDNLGDLKMTDAPKNQVISIGFLNERDDENRDAFMKSFDVVIQGDGSLEYVNAFLKEFTLN